VIFQDNDGETQVFQFNNFLGDDVLQTLPQDSIPVANSNETFPVM